MEKNINFLISNVPIYHSKRPDRDDFIDVIFENMNPVYNLEFKKLEKGESRSLNQPYDFDSIMHYSSVRKFSVQLFTHNDKISHT